MDLEDDSEMVFAWNVGYWRGKNYVSHTAKWFIFSGSVREIWVWNEGFYAIPFLIIFVILIQQDKKC